MLIYKYNVNKTVYRSRVNKSIEEEVLVITYSTN